jgi:hypothetical protein
MNKKITSCILSLLLGVNVFSEDSIQVNQSLNMPQCHFKGKQALEVESLFPMFITGGFHIGIGYRLDKFRIRASLINGGSYNAEKAGVGNSSSEFERHYKTSPGIFLGYNVWKNLEIYGYLEFHNFEIEQKSTGIKKNLFSVDSGGGIGYQFFVWKGAYVQPAFHIYLRKGKNVQFDDATYKISNVDISPVIRIGYRLWSK